MVTISDLSCVKDDGKPLYGTAAILYRLFHTEKQDDKTGFSQNDIDEYKALIKKCGYGYFDE